MSDITRITAPTNNVNDDSVEIFEILVDDESLVEKGQSVLAIETSKATSTIEAPVTGYIKIFVSIGDEVPNGELLAIIASKKDSIEEYINKHSYIQKESSSSDNSNITSIPPIDTLSSLKDVTQFGVYDCSVTLGEIYVKNGQKVNAGDELCKVRKGKSTESLKAPTDGYVHWNVRVYRTAMSGQPLGSISDSPVIKVNDTIALVRQYDSLRVSKEAKKLLNEKNLNPANLGLTGLVTVDHVRRMVNFDKYIKSDKNLNDKQACNMRSKTSTVTNSVEGHYEKLSKTKQAEARFLTSANVDTVVSQVSVLVPTKGIFSACGEDPDLASKYSSIIIFEVGKLLRNYKQMLSIYDDGRIFVYDHINIGYAISVDDGLRVPVFKDADMMDIEDISSQKEKYIEKYLSHKLDSMDLEGGTFTITDLSSTGCYLFNPVLNIGQSVILGIGSENPEKTNYPLILAFDHRVIDGALATEFLIKLRDRLIAHENVLVGKNTNEDRQAIEYGEAYQGEFIDNNNLICDSCFRAVDEVEKMGHYLFKVVDKYGKEKHICSICMKGW